jgi:predicted ArsR family transcriptional regulator
MAITRKSKKDGTPQRSILQFSIDPILEAKLMTLTAAIESGGDPSPELLSRVLEAGADKTLAEIDAQRQRVDSLDERLNHLEAVVAQGFEAILAKLDESI